MRINTFFLFLITLGLSIYLSIDFNKNIDEFITLQLGIIIISSISIFLNSHRPYTLYKIFHFFNLFFLGIAPILQYYSNVTFVGEPRISNAAKITASSIILITSILFNVVYYLFNKECSNIKKYQIYQIKKIKTIKFDSNKMLILFITALVSLLVVLAMNKFSFVSLIMRSSYAKSLNLDKSAYLIIDKFIRPLSLSLLLITLIFNHKNIFFNFLTFLIFLLTCFPTGISRNAVASYYLPILLIVIPVFRRKNIFVSILIISLLTVFPFLNQFRQISKVFNPKIELNLDMFKEIHFDAYSSLARIIDHDIITNGNQLKGVLFFFVPRSIWADKPYSSGTFHANKIGMFMDNVSCTYLAEGYINFGIVGVLLFIIILGIFSSVLDQRFWNKSHSVTSVVEIEYIIIVSSLLFILRGDLMNSFSYIVGILISLRFAFWLLNKV
jgi:hypothetical protein